MSEPRDQELEDYLAGRSEVSRLYRQAPADVPPPELDAKIRAAARRELASRRPRWLLPLSAAAVLMLSVGVLLRMQQEGVTPVPAEEGAIQASPASTMQAPVESTGPAIPAPRADTPPAAMPSRESQKAIAVPFPAAPVTPAPAQGTAQPRSADEAAGSSNRDMAEPQTSSPAAMDDAARAERQAPAREPEDWIRYIRDLRTADRDTEATAELAAFRERYPDYPLPEDLR